MNTIAGFTVPIRHGQTGPPNQSQTTKEPSMLKSMTVCYQVVDSFDLEEFVLLHTGREWSFVAAGEYGNDSQHTFHPCTTHFSVEAHEANPDWTNSQCQVPGLDKWDADLMRKFIADSDGYPHPQTMLNWLAVEGHIAPGNWLIEVCW